MPARGNSQKRQQEALENNQLQNRFRLVFMPCQQWLIEKYQNDCQKKLGQKQTNLELQ